MCFCCTNVANFPRVPRFALTNDFLIYATPLQYSFHPLTQAASLGYDEHEHTWNRDAFERNKESAAEYTALHPFIPAASTANNGVSAGISSGAISVAKASSSAKLVSSEPAGKSAFSPDYCDIVQGYLVSAPLCNIQPLNHPFFLLFIYISVFNVTFTALPAPGRAAGLDPDEAAAAIKAMKLQELEQSQREAEERAAAAQKAAELTAQRLEAERLALEEEEEEEERLESERQKEAERKLQEARAAAFKRKAERDAAKKAEAERVARELEQLQQEEENERLEQEQLEKEARERRQRNLARQRGASIDDVSEDTASISTAGGNSPTAPGASSPNPIHQRDGKAKDVVNPLKRVSSIRRVPPPPPPPSTDDADSAAVPALSVEPAASPAAAAPTVVEGKASTETASASASATSPKVIRMVGKRRASQQRAVHNANVSNILETGSSISGTSSVADQSDDEEDVRRSDEDAACTTPNAGKSVLKSQLDSPMGSARGTDSPNGGGMCKSLSRGVSFAADVRDPIR